MRLVFDGVADGPDKAGELASDGGCDFASRLSVDAQLGEFAMQSLLSFLCDRCDVGRHLRQVLLEAGVEPGPIARVPSGFTEYVSEVSVAGASDATLTSRAPLECSLGTRPV